MASVQQRLAALEKERQKKLEALHATAEAKADLARAKAEAIRKEEERQALLRANAETEAEYQLELKKAANPRYSPKGIVFLSSISNSWIVSIDYFE